MNKAIIFDIFGVLYPDTFWGLANSYLPDRSQQKQQELHDIVRSSDTGMLSQEDFWQHAAVAYGVEFEQVMKDRKSMGGIDHALLDYIESLKKRGCKIGIISNVGQGFIDRALPDKSKKDLFDSIVLSGEVGYLKPSIEIFKIASTQLDLPSDNCLFFDDIQRNVEGARDAGMHAELYTDFMTCKKQVEAFIS